MNHAAPKQDVVTVDSESRPIRQWIDGVIIRPAITHVDERGTLCELYSPVWDVNPDPMVYSYLFTVAPGAVKGWGVHYKRTDRVVQLTGRVKCVMYDDRPESPTYRMINEINTSAYERHLMIIPPHVWHVHWNFGTEEAMFISYPTQPYNHADPDIYRLPVNNDYIPYRFDFERKGW
jgi:dTDP-4-dehydrorhamnose 3,5-epimerase